MTSDRKIVMGDARENAQTGEKLVNAYFRLVEERAEFKSEGHCGTNCPCKVKCRG